MKDQIPGLWVDSEGDNDGSIRREVDWIGGKETPSPKRKICRWSFRLEQSGKSDYQNTWNPNANQVIADGAKVRMYCHSYNSGTCRDVANPPYFAPSVHKKPGEVNLKVLRSSVDEMRPIKASLGTNRSLSIFNDSRSTVQGYIEQ